MYFPFLERISNVLDLLVNVLIKFAFLLSGFFIIYLGIKNYFATRNFGEIKKAFLYIILGLILISLVFLNREIILNTIEYFVPSFK